MPIGRVPAQHNAGSQAPAAVRRKALGGQNSRIGTGVCGHFRVAELFPRNISLDG